MSGNFGEDLKKILHAGIGAAAIAAELLPSAASRRPSTWRGRSWRRARTRRPHDCWRVCAPVRRRPDG
jgi:hypothetical protein